MNNSHPVEGIEGLQAELAQSGIDIEYASLWTVDEHGFKCHQSVGKNRLRCDLQIARESYLQSTIYQDNRQYSCQLRRSAHYTNIIVINSRAELNDEQIDLFHHASELLVKRLGDACYFQLLNQSSDSAIRAETVHQVLNLIASSTDILNDEAAISEVAQRVQTLVDCPNLIIARLSDDSQKLHSLYFNDEYDDSRFPFDVDGAFLDGSVTAFVAKFGFPIRGSSEDILSGLGVSTDHSFGKHSTDCIGIPIKSASTVYGALVIQSYQAGFLFADYVPGVLGLVAEAIANKAMHTRQQAKLNHQIELRTAELQQKNAELSQTIDLLHQTRTDLVKSETQANLAKVVFNIAHFLNTPLGNAKMSLSIIGDLLKTVVGKSQGGPARLSTGQLDTFNDARDLTHSAIEKASAIVEDFRKLASDKAEYSLSNFTTNTLFDALKSKADFKIGKRNIQLECRGDDRPIESYASAILEVLSCLLDNSLQHGYGRNDSGKISVVASKVAGQLHLFYSDDGKGVDAQMKARMFELFESGCSSATKLGLGLAVTRLIVTNVLKGEVKVSSAGERGLSFDIVVPLGQ